jgi:hypothetical protein
MHKDKIISMRNLSSNLIIQKNVILDHIRRYFESKTCSNCKYMKMYYKGSGNSYYECSHYNKDSYYLKLDRKNLRRRKRCENWSIDETILKTYNTVNFK